MKRRHTNHKINRYPLRKIVEVVRLHEGSYGSPDVFREVLECGHVVRPKHDMFGPTNAYSRRCKECARVATTVKM